MRNDLLEKLAELEHGQWMNWTKYIAQQVMFEGVKPTKLLMKWYKNWKPYSELSEEEKEKDRVWARKALSLLTKNTKKGV